MSNVILINPFEVPKGKEEECLQMWERGAEYLKKQPGYINTKLHQSMLPDSKFHFVNVAEWETPEAFFKAVQSEEFLKIVEGSMDAYPHYPCLYTIIRN
ncbi:MAG: antibiotic biosynthesis monooxygenase family protein [Thermodesulfobacteriota bacterium]